MEVALVGILIAVLLHTLNLVLAMFSPFLHSFDCIWLSLTQNFTREVGRCTNHSGEKTGENRIEPQERM